MIRYEGDVVINYSSFLFEKNNILIFQGNEHLAFLKPTLHLHLNHPVTEGLLKLRKTDPKTAQLLLEQVR